MSHHHTYYVSSSYILCHIIIVLCVHTRTYMHTHTYAHTYALQEQDLGASDGGGKEGGSGTCGGGKEGGGGRFIDNQRMNVDQ